VSSLVELGAVRSRDLPNRAAREPEDVEDIGVHRSGDPADAQAALAYRQGP
jgi:hypothetical protein